MEYIVVTGAASGIGKAFCDYLNASGKYGFIAVDRDADKLKMLYPDNHIVCDLTNFESIEQLFTYCLDKNYKLKGIVHCAGICKVQEIDTISEFDMTLTYKVNVFSFIEMYKHFAKYENRSEKSKVLALSSITANRAYKGQLLYASSKAALESCAKSMAQDAIQKNITVNILELGAVKTEMFESLSPNYETINRHYPLGLLTPSETAAILQNLFDESFDRLSGSIITVDSGFSVVH